MTFTKAEREAITIAWSHLTDYAMSSGMRHDLEESARLEKRSFNEPIPQLQARAMVISWFWRGYTDPSMPISSLGGTRHTYRVAVSTGTDAAARSTAIDAPTMAAAIAAYEAASHRNNDVLQAAFAQSMAAYKAARG
jgi:hypothetical protein